MATRAQLIAAAKDLNRLLELEPPIDVQEPIEQIVEQIKQVANLQLLNPADAVEQSTRDIYDALVAGQEVFESEPEAQSEAPAPAVPIRRRTPQVEQAAEVAPTRGGGLRPYPGSLAEKIDLAAMEGGTMEEVAAKLGYSPGRVRSHIKFRMSKGKFAVEGDLADGKYFKMVRVEQPTTTT